MKDKLILNVRELAGDELTDRLIDLLGDERKTVRWFYGRLRNIGCSAYECYKSGDEEKIDKVNQIIAQLEKGGYS